MKRRTFVKSALGAAALTPVLLDRVIARPSTPLPLLAQLSNSANDKILILIQLFGGNDGLNTIVPADDPNYYSIRPTIGIPKQLLVPSGSLYMNPGLAGSNGLGGLSAMLDVGTLAVVQGIGYNPPNLSHFRSTDIWLSGINNSDPNVALTTGWLGRFLEARYPDFPNNLPQDPLAINFGGFSLALTSEKGRMGIEVADPSLQAAGLSAAADQLDDQSAGTRYALEYAFVQDVANRSNVYAQRVKDAYNAGKPKLKSTYGSDTLAQQLGAVAALIAGGLDTRVYVVGMGGFDTHVNQVDGSNPAVGQHTNLLQYLANAISAFQYDLLQLDQAGPKVSDRVLGMTISEFGRRPDENGSYGTDHGAASVQFVFGRQVNGVVIGQNPDLANLDSNADLRYQYDYRQVYLTLLTDWFGMTLPDARAVLDDTNGNITPLDLIKGQQGVAGSKAVEHASVSVYPNPMAGAATLAIELPESAYVSLTLNSVDGKLTRVMTESQMSAGRHLVPVTTDLPSGAYLLSMETASGRSTSLVTIIR